MSLTYDKTVWRRRWWDTSSSSPVVGGCWTRRITRRMLLRMPEMWAKPSGPLCNPCGSSDGSRRRRKGRLGNLRRKDTGRPGTGRPSWTTRWRIRRSGCDCSRWNGSVLIHHQVLHTSNFNSPLRTYRKAHFRAPSRWIPKHLYHSRAAGRPRWDKSRRDQMAASIPDRQRWLAFQKIDWDVNNYVTNWNVNKMYVPSVCVYNINEESCSPLRGRRKRKRVI